jgi:hypothetical protein
MSVTKKYNGREIKKEHSFKVEVTFESVYAAYRWCTENGYEDGSMCSLMPIAIMKGKYNLPQKWKNMTTAQRNSVDGVIISNDFREGEVIIYIFN